MFIQAANVLISNLDAHSTVISSPDFMHGCSFKWPLFKSIANQGAHSNSPTMPERINCHNGLILILPSLILKWHSEVTITITITYKSSVLTPGSAVAHCTWWLSRPWPFLWNGSCCYRQEMHHVQTSCWKKPCSILLSSGGVFIAKVKSLGYDGHKL